MELSRRRFLRSLLALPALPLGLKGQAQTPMSPSEAAVASDPPRSARMIHAAGAWSTGQHGDTRPEANDSGVALAPGSKGGEYLADAVQAGFRFNAVALAWHDEISPGGAVNLELRTSEDGITWSDWAPVQEMADLAHPVEQHYSELALASGQYVQWRARLTRSAEPGAGSPVLRDVTIIYIDSTAGPSGTEAAALAVQAATAAQDVAAPYVIPRAAWGCPQPYGTPSWPPEYQPIDHLVVHHTAHLDNGGANTYLDGAAVVRAVWEYHVAYLGWGDIGYNFLVDRFGNVYEGRFGGLDVVAGHALQYNRGSAGISVIGNFEYGDVSQGAHSALTRVLAWLAYRRDIYPFGWSWFVDRTAANISAHRDLLATACPGYYLFLRMDALRSGVWNLYPVFGDGWLGHDTPPEMGTGRTVVVNVTVYNRGRLAWAAGGANPVHLGYHWYHSDGTQYEQPPADDHRTSLPGDVPYGGSVALAALLTAPAEPGTYTLKWDVVEEGVTWFSWQGSPTLDVTVTVLPVLVLDRSAVAFLGGSGSPARPQTLAISGIGSGTSWQAASSQPWCTLSATSGNGPAALVLAVNPTGLALDATHHAVITVSAGSALDSPQQIAVTFVNSSQPLDYRFLPALSR